MVPFLVYVLFSCFRATLKPAHRPTCVWATPLKLLGRLRRDSICRWSVCPCRRSPWSEREWSIASGLIYHKTIVWPFLQGENEFHWHSSKLGNCFFLFAALESDGNTEADRHLELTVEGRSGGARDASYTPTVSANNHSMFFRVPFMITHNIMNIASFTGSSVCESGPADWATWSGSQTSNLPTFSSTLPGIMNCIFEMT